MARLAGQPLAREAAPGEGPRAVARLEQGPGCCRGLATIDPCYDWC